MKYYPCPVDITTLESMVFVEFEGNLTALNGTQRAALEDAFLATYNQVVQSVQAIAKQYQISLVLRYDSQPIDPNNPNDILKGINRAVIHQQNLDITKTVLDMVNRSAPRRPTAGAGNTLTTPGTQQRPATSAVRPNTFRNQ